MIISGVPKIFYLRWSNELDKLLCIKM